MMDERRRTGAVTAGGGSFSNTTYVRRRTSGGGAALRRLNRASKKMALAGKRRVGQGRETERKRTNECQCDALACNYITQVHHH